MAEEQIRWYRSPIDKESLRSFTQRRDLPGFLQAGSFLSIYLCTTAAALYFFLSRLWVPMVIVCYLHSLFQFMLGMSSAVHELSHGTPFRRKGPNEFFYHLFCFLTWNNPVHFRASHMLHHQFTLYPGRDKEVIKRPARETLNWVNYLSWATFDFKWFWTFLRVNVQHALGNGEADFFDWDPLFPKEDPRRRAMIRWARFALVSYVGLTVVFAVLHLWVLIYLVVFGSFFVTIMGKTTGSLQHTGLSDNTPDWRAIAHTVIVNPVVGYLYWHMNYHIEHHMYAAVPFYKLARFHKALRADMPVPTRTFSAGLRRLSQIKKMQAHDPSYVFIPEMPATAAPIEWR
jgi:fatty acid desaturase